MPRSQGLFGIDAKEPSHLCTEQILIEQPLCSAGDSSVDKKNSTAASQNIHPNEGETDKYKIGVSNGDRYFDENNNKKRLTGSISNLEMSL